MIRTAWRWTCLALSTGAFLTYVPARLRRDKKLTGAGLIGSAWGILLVGFLPSDPLRQGLVWLGALLLSIVISDVAEEVLGTVDDPRIVIDEFIGVWTAVLFLPHTPAVLILGFILFRVFDVLKPGPIKRVSQWPGGYGVVMDDILAGVIANGMLRVIHFVHLI